MPAPRKKRILQAPFVPPAKPESPLEQNQNLDGSILQDDAPHIPGKNSGEEEGTIKQVVKDHTPKTAVNTSTLIDNSHRDHNIDEQKVNEQNDMQKEPLFALLNNSVSPLVNLDDTQKLTWLRSQLIGEEQEFPTPFGKRILIYADHTASGKSLFFIENFITRHLLPFYGNTHTDDSYVGRRTSRIMRQAEEYIKERMGGSEEDALLMCGWGCTAAIKRLQEVMGIAVPSILRGHVLDRMQESMTQDKERWLVFVGPYEHHSNLLSWRQSLAEVREIPATEEGLIDVEQLEAELQAAEAAGRRRKLGSFSACSNVTGLLTNTRAIARLLHKYGAFACFDFAAGAPHLHIDMRSGQEDGYDAIVMSPHKFLGGPGTPGLLLMSKNLYILQKQPPSTCGGGTVAYVNGFNEKDTLYYEGVEEREEGGTPPIVGKVRCALAFWLKEAMGVPLIRLREALYLNKALKRLSVHPNVQVLGGQAHNRVPILSFLINTQAGKMQAVAEENTSTFSRKPLHGRFVVKLLNDLFGIQARGGCACAGPYGHFLLGVNDELSLAIRHAIQMGYEGLKPGWARLGLCYSMTEEEVDFILSAIEFIADHGHRFLSVYDFDWRSGNWTYKGHIERQQSIQALIELPENDMSRSRRLGLRKYLRRAKSLSHLLPKCPTPKPIPHDVDPKLLLFSL
ncbi:hypothetical protein GOP47_0019478 [Adiantum capillus-veneris]|uniref:Aminotransferase class V domain-containing protein n=1 Tax=Adiantum capillus-veneris TaxID=13818 RepID=A0A9D4UB42_ADICA|nr:hypothetical protein GOP47_0019478 [Adiantum capillus-veneris]